jgi:Domain of unknown function (DUF4159)
MKSGVKRLVWAALGVVGILGIGAGISHAQQIWAGGYGYTPPRFPTSTTFAGSFNFCRVMFPSNRREKRGWDTDYPGADINFSIRLSELTKADVKMEHGGGGEEENPDAVVVRLTDDALFQCPFTIMEDAGTAHFTPPEVARLHDYLLKGGFLVVSDYHGTLARAQFDEEIGRALPPSQYPIVDLTPPDHAIWHTLFEVKKIPQMASIQTWRRTGGVLERWNDNGAGPDARGIADERGRLMVVMLHNTDIPDGWEREGEDPEYFFRFSPDSYAVGIDVVMYGMTH